MPMDARHIAVSVLAAILFSISAVQSYYSSISAIQPGSALPSGAVSAADSARMPVFPMDVNVATEDDLTLLPGIGDKTAKALVEARPPGGFRSLDAVAAAGRIGKSRMKKLEGLINVNGGSDERRRP